MKYLYTILLAVVLPFICFGQKDADSASLTAANYLINGGIILGGTGLVSTKIINSKNDTVRVIILCIDTLSSRKETLNGKRTMFWQFGYEVWITDNYTFIDRYYLDEKKKPLPKSIIGFQSVPLNKNQ